MDFWKDEQQGNVAEAGTFELSNGPWALTPGTAVTRSAMGSRRQTACAAPAARIRGWQSFRAFDLDPDRRAQLHLSGSWKGDGPPQVAQHATGDLKAVLDRVAIPLVGDREDSRSDLVAKPLLPSPRHHQPRARDKRIVAGKHAVLLGCRPEH